MSVIDGGITHGCSNDLENRAYGIAFAARDLERVLRGGGSLPKEYTIAGQVYRVVRITGVVADGKTNNQTALAAAVSASRGGTPTLLVLPPSASYYRYNSQLDLSDNTYVIGYGAKVKPLGYENTAWRLANNSGIFGLHMDGLDGSYSRWLERLQTNVTVEPSKPGSVMSASSSDDGDAWIQAWGKTNVILKSIRMWGSVKGAVRSTSNNMLVEDCSTYRMHSDSFHIIKESQNVTCRRCHVLEGGDDGFSMIQYNSSPGNAQPRNILIEDCEVSGSRGRGFTTVSGRDILFLRCLATNTALAPFMAACTGAHSLTNCNGIKFVECQAWRGAKRVGGGRSNGAGFSIWTDGTDFQVLGTEVRNCKARWYTAGVYNDNFTGGIRESGNVSGTSSSGNDFAAIVASE